MAWIKNLFEEKFKKFSDFRALKVKINILLFGKFGKKKA